MNLTQLYKYRSLATTGKWKELEELFNRSEQLKQGGFSIDLSNPVEPRAIIEKVESYHEGGIGSDAVNGGVIAALADLAMSLLGLQHYADGMTATAQITVHYLKPFRTSKLTAVASIQKVIGNRIFGNVEIMNAKGEVCAIANGALAKGISL